MKAMAYAIDVNTGPTTMKEVDSPDVSVAHQK